MKRFEVSALTGIERIKVSVKAETRAVISTLEVSTLTGINAVLVPVSVNVEQQEIELSVFSFQPINSPVSGCVMRSRFEYDEKLLETTKYSFLQGMKSWAFSRAIEDGSTKYAAVFAAVSLDELVQIEALFKDQQGKWKRVLIAEFPPFFYWRKNEEFIYRYRKIDEIVGELFAPSTEKILNRMGEEPAVVLRVNFLTPNRTEWEKNRYSLIGLLHFRNRVLRLFDVYRRMTKEQLIRGLDVDSRSRYNGAIFSYIKELETMGVLTKNGQYLIANAEMLQSEILKADLSLMDEEAKISCKKRAFKQ